MGQQREGKMKDAQMRDEGTWEVGRGQGYGDYKIQGMGGKERGVKDGGV